LKLLTRTQQTQMSWSLSDDGLEASSIAEEFRLAWQTDSGEVLQHTEEHAQGRLSVPVGFLKERNLWSTFLKKCRLDAFRIECEVRAVSVLGPPITRVQEPLNWRLNLRLTTPSLGRLMVSRSYRGSLPPSRRLMERLSALKRLGRLQMRPYAGETVVLPGEILLRSLSTAMDQLVARTSEAGRWLQFSPPLPGDQRLSYRESFREARFQPTNVLLPPPQSLYVLDYDPDDLALICARQGGEDACKLMLEEPLYRYVGALRYGRQEESLVVKDIQYHMPQAWFSGSLG